MNSMQLAHEIEQLASEAQHQVEDFIASIKIKLSDIPKNHQPQITKGDKTINPKSLFGIWEDDPRNLEDIRKKLANVTRIYKWNLINNTS